jgi:phosphoglycolate phosphatase-like HAD superfamily hydrolase
MLMSVILMLAKRGTFAAEAIIYSKIYPVTLLTFDVDGTLLQGSSKQTEISAHAKAFMHATGKIFHDDSAYEIKSPSPMQYIPPDRYHGSTDGLIALNLAKYSANIDASVSYPKLDSVFEHMYDYIRQLSDEQVAYGIEALPGVISTLQQLKMIRDKYPKNILCGLVTGNVEGIARKKMRATGILATGALYSLPEDSKWLGEEKTAFLGGFGSDFCSGNIDDLSRLYKDRAEQIAIATKKAQALLSIDQKIVRVVHIGDAPNDVLAAKYCSETSLCGEGVIVGCIGVATGKFSATVLEEHAGKALAGVWEPVVLESGMNDPKFIEYCRLEFSET